MANKLNKGAAANGRAPGRRKASNPDDAPPTQPNGQAPDQQQAADDARKPMGNVSDETIQEVTLEYLAARKDLDDAVDVQRKVRANVSAIKKRAKKLGIDPDYLARYHDMRNRDPKEVEKEVAEFNRVLVAMRFPVGYQLGLFADGETVGGKVDKAKQEAAGGTPDSVAHARAEGVQASEDGKPIGNNPHDLNTAEFDAFEDGYAQHQRKRAREMGGAEGATAH